MVFDFDGVPDRDPPVMSTCDADPRDLERIVTAIQLAAISLTPRASSEFTKEELLGQVLFFDERIDPADFEIVLPNARFLGKRGTRWFLK